MSSHPRDARRLALALVLLAAFTAAEVVVAVLADSVALFSDAAHMLSDIAALALSYAAVRLSARPATGSWTFGWKRAGTLSAAVNGIALLALGALVTTEAVRRLVHPPTDTRGWPVLVVALVGIAVNLAATGLLGHHDHGDLAVEGAFQHLLTDLYGFAGTAVAAVVLLTTSFERADAIASLFVVVLMVRASWTLLHRSGRILLEVAPADMDLEEVRAHLLQAAHVREVHDLHVWAVTNELPTLSAHVVVEDSCFLDGHAPQVLDELQDCIGGHFDVEHSTFQLEPASHAAHEAGLHCD